MKNQPASGLDRLYLVRHGSAEDTHPLGDEARALTAEGRRAFRKLCAEIGGELGLRGIACSPLVRAVQTAEILAEAAGVDEIRIEAALAADDATVAGIAALARKLGPGWALVGHNPSFAAAYATWSGIDPDETSFRKGAVAAFRVGNGGALTRLFVVSPGRKRQDF